MDQLGNNRPKVQFLGIHPHPSPPPAESRSVLKGFPLLGSMLKGSPARAGIDPEQPKGMAESSLSARPPPLQYEWSQNMTKLQKIESESRQKLQKIESESRQKLQKIESESRQKLIPYTFSGHESLSGLPDPISSETLTAESRAKVEAIQTEYHRKWAAIVAERDRKRAAIVAEREARLADERNRTQKQDCPGKIGRPT